MSVRAQIIALVQHHTSVYMAAPKPVAAEAPAAAPVLAAPLPWWRRWWQAVRDWFGA